MRSAYLSAISSLAPGVAIDWCGRGATCPVSPDAVLSRRRADTDWFDAKATLPGIRHRYLSDATCFSLAAALRCREQVPCDTAGEQRGVVVGTSVADQAVRSSFDQSALREGANGLNTVAAPNMSANIVAAHVAITCQGRAFSTTLTSAGLAGFESLYLGLQAIAAGRSEQVLCVSTEDAWHGSAVLPGALALQIDAAARGAQRSVQALAWGRVGNTANAATRRLNQAVRSLPPAQLRRARLVRIVEPSAQSHDTADICLHELAASGVSLPHTDCSVAGIGSFEPLLRAAPWITAEQPVLLLAVHRRRFLAFFVLP